MSIIKDDKKDFNKESSTLQKELMLSSNPTVLNKSSDIDTISPCNDQESITLDIFSKNSESRRFEEITKPNIHLDNELGSPEDDRIEKMAMMPSSDPTDKIPVESFSFQGKLD